MILRLREKLPTTVQSILPTADSLFTFFQSAGKLTLVASVLLQPIVQPAASAQEKSLRRTSGANVRRFDSASERIKSRSKAKPSTWTSPRSLNNTDDRLSWKRPLHTGLGAIHNKKPSFIAPPKSMKRAELPADLANPGSVTKSIYVEPTSGNAVVTADGKPSVENESVENSSNVEQAGYDELAPLPLNPPQKANRIGGSSNLRTASRRTNARRQSTTRQAADRRDVRVAQDDVFGDQGDFDGLPEALDESDMEAFSDNELSADTGEEFGGSSTDEADSRVDDGGFGDDGFGDTQVDDFGPIDDASDGLPGPAGDEPSFDDSEFGDQDGVVDELPPPGDSEDQTASDQDVGPVRRPETLSDEMTSDAEPVDLSAYNGRNCPEELAVYEAATEALLNRPITAISLDITSEIEPNAGAEEMAQKREEALRDAPPREWRNRSGQVVATGYMKDFKDGRVQIESETGETKSVEFHDLSSADMCSVCAWWGIPTEYQVDVEPYEVRNWTTQTFTWKASGLCHKPLYFEEVQLERYGHSAGPIKQTMLSGAHFFGNLIFLPYKMGVHPPNECQYALGYYRPGDCAPWLLHAIPLSARGARLQTAAMLGGIGLVP